MGTASQAPVQRVGFFRALWRAARQVFHETMGTIFFLLALIWASATLRLWRHGSAAWVWAICGSFAIMMAIFGLTSFRMARRVR
jgi:hypothetical protein